jgi:Na+:H+ antiporter, NhaA family
MTRAIRFAVDRYLALPAGAALALVWANALPASYFQTANALAFAVNDVGMTLFFAVMTREVMDAAMPDGALYTWRRLALAGVAALGGLIGALATYAAYLSLGDEASILIAGWPVICATDLAFTYFIARSICGPRVVPFVVLVGIVSDVIALVVLEVRYPIGEVRSLGGALVGVAIAATIVMRRCEVRSVWPFLLGAGVLSWWGLYLCGLHPALALVPIVPWLTRSSRHRPFMTDAPAGARDALSRLHRTLKYPVHVVLFLFGLANAGVILRGAGTGTWAIAAAALVGRPIGMALAVLVAVALGLRLPRYVGWREMTVLTIASSTGFTFALFFATVVYPVGPVLGEIKLGALMTASAAILTIGAAWILRVGRFAHVTKRRRVAVTEYAGV